MTSERALMEADLVDCIEGEFGSQIQLVGPDGTQYATSQTSALLPLTAMVNYSARLETLSDSGMPLVIKELTVTIRRTSLPPAILVPNPGRWIMRLPQNPASSALTDYILDGTRAPEQNQSVGFVRFYPKKVAQG